MAFRLVPKSVTLNDLERRNGRYLVFFSPNSVHLGPIKPKWSKIDLHSLQQECSPMNLLFSDISPIAIFAEVTENECIIERRVRDMHPLLDDDASESHSMLSI